MANIKIILKAIKMKLLFNELAAAKENSVRAHLGLPPKVKWYKKLCNDFTTFIKEKICAMMFPCCIYVRKHRLKEPGNCWGRMFTSKTTENIVFRECLGLVSGVIVSILVYLILALQLEISYEVAFYISAILSVVFTIGLTFFKGFRCFLILLIPSMASGRGRMLMLVYVFYLMMNFPVQNFNNNIVIMSTSSTCAQELALNQTKDLIAAATAPITELIRRVKEIKRKLIEFRDKMKAVYESVAKIADTITGVINRAARWVKDKIDLCNETLGAPYKTCHNGCISAAINCKSMLPFFLRWLCELPVLASHVCHVARFPEMLCLFAGAVKDLLNHYIAQPVKNELMKAAEMFYFNVSIVYHYNYTMNQSKEYSDVQKQIVTEIQEKTAGFMKVFSVIQKILMFAFTFVFIKTLRYYLKYRFSKRYDNNYITFTVRDIDERRKALGHKSIFPLECSQEKSYINSTSPRLLPKEGVNMVLGMVMLGVSAFNVGFYLVCDYGLYSILHIIYENFSAVSETPIPPHTMLDVQGRGPMADIYRSMVSMFDPMARSYAEVDVTRCVPVPSKPNLMIYKRIGIILGVCLVLTIVQPYIMRVRHMIMGCFYPKKDRERAYWLYSHILRTKDPLIDAIKSNIDSRIVGDEGYHTSIMGEIASRFPLFERIFKFVGWNRKYCVWCGREGKPDDFLNFVHCINPGCDAIYCIDCFVDINNTCNLCMMRLVLGDSESEEIDSSLDEREIAKSNKRKIKRDKLISKIKAERRPSAVLQKVKESFLAERNISYNNPRIYQRLADGNVKDIRCLFKQPSQKLEYIDDSDASSSMELNDSDFEYQYEGRSSVYPVVQKEGHVKDNFTSKRRKPRLRKVDLKQEHLFTDSSSDDSDNKYLSDSEAESFNVISDVPEIKISRS